MLDWGLIKLQWELFGASAKELAEEYGLALSVIEYAAEENKWRRLPIAQAAQDWTNLEKVDQVGEELLDEIQTHFKILHTIREAVLGPKYIAIETGILNRSLEVLKTLDPSNPGNITYIKDVTDILKSLKAMSGSTISGVTESKESAGVSVKILNHVGDKETYVQQAIDITVETPKVEDGGRLVAPALPASGEEVCNVTPPRSPLRTAWEDSQGAV